ncbi:MAG: bifunctional hydroxymethylpyrimidine kinase/phosphomethylpyrimidine kinase, partial [Pseudomonadota bacterium]|nr:bifunctional hydroxymethylpyrimidine kinase/phosphomethylpyrimidine kinase [Pseudomonadota bacterium]
MKVPRVLIIAGSDSGGGAGIQADIKTVTMLGGHAMTAITALTAQNTLAVEDVLPVPTDIVLRQVDVVVSDLGVDAVKIGMIGSPETAHAVAERLQGIGDVPIVFDPVMIASSGSVLADDATIAAFERLMRSATVTTPNVPELQRLSGGSGEESARAIAKRYGCAVLAKGGDSPDEEIVDVLVQADGEATRWTGARIHTRHTHGTGCTLASAIAVHLGHGRGLPQAVELARSFVRRAMLAAPGFGAGAGPLGHSAAGTDEMNLNHVTLPALDYAASVAFYRALGLTQIVDSPDRYARFECPGGSTLSIHVEEGMDAGGATIGFESADLDAWVERLVAAGMEFT